MASTSATGAGAGSSSNSAGPSGGSADTSSRKGQRPSRPSSRRHPPKPKKGAMPPKKKSDTNVSRLFKTDVAAEDKGLQKALGIHCRILSGCFKASDIPELPSEDLQVDFESRFGPVDKLAELREELRKAPSHNEEMVKVRELRTAVRQATSQIANDISRVKDNFLLIIFSAVRCAGLKKWRPDILGAPDSLYNQAHQMVAVQTFQIVASAFAYGHLRANISKLQNIILLNQFYEHHWFYRMAKSVKMELKTPGSVQKALDDGNTYKRRTTLDNHRTDFCVNEGFPERALGIVQDVECHSDDEGPYPNPQPAPGPLKSIYYIQNKPPRNGYITDLYRDLDTRRFAAAEGLGKSQYLITERSRQYDAARAKNTDISRRFPPNATLDWFSPDYFNQLPASIRRLYRNNGIALPLPAHWDEDWKSLDDDEFMKKYGNEVLKLYQLPAAGADDEDEDEVEMMIYD
ncbi:hypothetical protein C8R43DRAFT_943790 [Mycena crocata]|nr:hypothetical protein C8R43DRAFT_943790 [Mycena crocata]